MNVEPRKQGLKTGSFDTRALIEKKKSANAQVVVKVDDRAAIRQKIIVEVRRQKVSFVTRSEWKAKESKASGLAEDWDYTGIALHHAGNSYACDADGAGKMRRVQEEHLGRGSSDIGYHYAIDCQGVVYEGRDIRYLGAHIGRVPKVIGIVLLADMSVRGEQRKIEGNLPWWKRSYFGALPTYDDIAVNHDEPTEVQINALETLTKVLRANFRGISRFGGHREWASQAGGSRACPGTYGLILADMMRRNLSMVKP